MINSSGRAIRWRNILLVGSCVSLGLALLTDPDVAGWTEPEGLLAMVLLSGGGFFVAMGMREFAGLIFDPKARPWYGQPGGPICLVVMLTAINAFLLSALGTWLPNMTSHHSFSLICTFFASIASELAWIAMLDWPTQDTQASASRRTYRASTKLQSSPSAAKRVKSNARTDSLIHTSQDGLRVAPPADPFEDSRMNR